MRVYVTIYGEGSQSDSLRTRPPTRAVPLTRGNFLDARKPPDRIKIDAGQSYLERLEFLQAGAKIDAG